MKTCVHCHAENPDDARYCQRCRFALDWGPEPGTGDARTLVLEPVRTGALDVALDPETVRLGAAESAQVRVRVRYRGDGDVAATLRISGDPAGYATLDPVTLHLRGGEEALALLEIGPLAGAPERMGYEITATALDGGATAGRATGQVDSPPRRRRTAGTGPASRVWPWVALVAVLAAVVAGAVLLGGGDGEVIDATTTAGIGARLRTEPSVGAERIMPNLPLGTAVRVECMETGPGPQGPDIRWYRLVAPPERAEGAFISETVVDIAGEPPTC